MRGIMVQGTSSDAGKSLIVTALCRLLSDKGYLVAPFKSQNMSSYTYTLPNGSKISNAQAIQAEAARILPAAWMNPIMLKPTSDTASEIILFGQSVGAVSGSAYRERYYEIGLSAVKQALETAEKQAEVLILEGAGSPVEINLKDRELVNMKVAEMADVPVLLVADIDRGGVFASIIGTLELLTSDELARVQGIIINKFRGEASLFADGVAWIEQRTGIPVIGVVPHINHTIPPEDSLSDDKGCQSNSEEQDRYDDLAYQISKHMDVEQIERMMERWCES